jgi:hypothetical protein
VSVVAASLGAGQVAASLGAGQVAASLGAGQVAASLGAGQNAAAYAEVHVTIDERHCSWLITEAWWAKAFATPSFKQLVMWSTKIVPWAIALHLAQSLRSTWQGKGIRGKGEEQSPVLVKISSVITTIIRRVPAALALAVGLLLFPFVVSSYSVTAVWPNTEPKAAYLRKRNTAKPCWKYRRQHGPSTKSNPGGSYSLAITSNIGRSGQ